MRQMLGLTRLALSPPPYQVESTDAENQLASHFIAPTTDSLQGLLVLVTHLLGRRVEVDVATQNSRMVRGDLTGDCRFPLPIVPKPQPPTRAYAALGPAGALLGLKP